MRVGLRNLLGVLPETSGVFVLYGANDHVLYIGRTASLRAGALRAITNYPHVKARYDSIKRIEGFPTDSNEHAIQLEQELLRKHTPELRAVTRVRSHDGDLPTSYTKNIRGLDLAAWRRLRVIAAMKGSTAAACINWAMREWITRNDLGSAHVEITNRASVYINTGRVAE